MKWIKEYIIFILASIVIAIMYLWNNELGLAAVDTVKLSLKEMIIILPPIFVLMGLLDVWIPKDTIVKYMGDKSGLSGILLSFLLGSAAAGPLYAAFPIASVFMKKGVKFSNILIFLGAWSTTKIPLLMFEYAAMGSRFTITRFSINIFGILAIAYIGNKFLSKEDIDAIYKKSEDL